MLPHKHFGRFLFTDILPVPVAKAAANTLPTTVPQAHTRAGPGITYQVLTSISAIVPPKISQYNLFCLCSVGLRFTQLIYALLIQAGMPRLDRLQITIYPVN